MEADKYMEEAVTRQQNNICAGYLPLGELCRLQFLASSRGDMSHVRISAAERPGAAVAHVTPVLQHRLPANAGILRVLHHVRRLCVDNGAKRASHAIALRRGLLDPCQLHLQLALSPRAD